MLEKVIEARKAQGLTQAELARRAGLALVTMNHLERGRIYPYPKARRLISSVLGISEEELFPGVVGDGDQTA